MPSSPSSHARVARASPARPLPRPRLRMPPYRNRPRRTSCRSTPRPSTRRAAASSANLSIRTQGSLDLPDHPRGRSHDVGSCESQNAVAGVDQAVLHPLSAAIDTRWVAPSYSMTRQLRIQEVGPGYEGPAVVDFSLDARLRKPSTHTEDSQPGFHGALARRIGKLHCLLKAPDTTMPRMRGRPGIQIVERNQAPS